MSNLTEERCNLDDRKIKLDMLRMNIGGAIAYVTFSKDFIVQKRTPKKSQKIV